MNHRERIFGVISSLASAEEQLEYERSLQSSAKGVGCAATELLEFGNDLFWPKDPDFIRAFSETELRRIAHLYGLVMECSRVDIGSVRELLKVREWRRVMALAKDMVRDFES